MTPSRRNDPCSCGSGRKYKHCCGRLAVSDADDNANETPDNLSRFSRNAEFKPSGYLVDRIQTDEQFERMCADQPPGQRVGDVVLPRGIMAKGGFADPDICKMLTGFADREGGFDSTIHSPVGAGEDSELIVRSEDRVSTNVDIRALSDQVVPQIVSAYREAEKFFGVEIEWFEYPELLRYSKGGHYLPHADAENWDPVRHCWVRGMDRDLSIIIYLNGEFEGGHLDFPNFGFRL